MPRGRHHRSFPWRRRLADVAYALGWVLIAAETVAASYLLYRMAAG